MLLSANLHGLIMLTAPEATSGLAIRNPPDGSIASRMGATVALRLLWVMMMPFIASVVL